MPYAIEMFFDEKSDGLVRSIWKSLKEHGISSYMNDSGSIPHITLSIFDNLDLLEASNLLELFTRKNSKMSLSLSSIGAFPSEEGVLFLAPVVTKHLLETHQSFHFLFYEFKDSQWPYYFPNVWVPHCTLSVNIPRNKVHDALDLVISSYKPLEIEINRVAIVEYYPVKVIKEFYLNNDDIESNKSDKERKEI